MIKNKKRIVFLPTYDYLSNDLFLSFIDRLSEYDTIYINNDEYQPIEKNSNIIKKFSKYFEVYSGYNFTSKPSFQKKIKSFFNNILFQKKLNLFFKSLDPDLLITTSDMSVAFKGIKAYCKINNIPIIIIQPSFFDYEKIYKINYKDRTRKFINFFIEIYPKQALWGNEDKETILFLWGSYFKNYYSNKKDIRIVGNPKYDTYISNNLQQFDIDRFKKKYNINNKKIITICTEAFGGLISTLETKLLFKFYKDIIISNKDIFFIIKLHPRENIQYINLNINLLNCIILSNEYTLNEIFQITDIQVSVASASSLEAVISNIPVILINPDNMININNFFNNTIELRSKNIFEFNNSVKLIFTTEWHKKFIRNRKKFLSTYLYKVGNSTINIQKHIKEIIDD